MQIYKSICPYDCPTSCGLLVETDGERIHKVKGDPGDPACGGLICRKMQHYEKSIHSLDRILTPLKRTGDKGEGCFEPISWDEAVETITGKWKQALSEYGPDSILPFYYSGVMSLIHRNCGDALFNKMGSCQLVKTLCSSAKSAGYNSVVGSTGCLDPRELADSDMYIVWGSNMKATRLQSMADLVKGRKQGKRVILIECFAGEMAEYCDQVVLMKPGTDGALALGMMHVLVNEELDDTEFLKNESIGYTEFIETLDQYTPEWAESVCGVPAEIIINLAREYAAASAPAIILGSGNSRYGNGGMTVRLITILSTFTGAWKYPGGGLCGCSPGSAECVDSSRITRPDFRGREGRKVNINQLATALKGGGGQTPIRCLHVYGSNPVGSVANQLGIQEGLLNPELFTVVHERFITDTAKYADIILPATFSVEQSDCYSAYGYRSFGAAYKLIPTPGECKSNWDIFCLLAEGMGYNNKHFQRSDDDLLRELLDNPKSDLLSASEEQIKTLNSGGAISLPFAEHTKWKTPSGKIEIVNSTIESPVPYYQECHGGSYPLKLIAVPSTQTLNSVFLERDELLESRGPMCLDIHPDDAGSRSISDGESIVAYNDLGEVAFTARVTEHVAKGVVAAAGIFKSCQSANGNLVNTLHHERLSDIGEATTLNDNSVEVRI